MRSQNTPQLSDRVHQGIRESLIAKMFAHFFHDALPQVISTFVVNPNIADYGKFLGARRYEYQHPVTCRSLVHFKPLKPLLSHRQSVGLQFASLQKNPDLAGSLLFYRADRLNDSVVVEFAEKFFRSHRFTNCRLSHLRQNFRRRH